MFVEVNGARIAYQDEGPRSGEVVLLSHSLFFDHGMFDPLVSLLNGAGFRTVTYDHRGQGASSVGSPDQLTMDALAEDAAELIRTLDLGPVHAVGNSMGGFVTLRLAARHPELLRTASALGASAEEEYRLEEFEPLAAALGQPGGAASLIDTLMFIMFGDATLAAGGAIVDRWRAYMADLEPSIGNAALGVIHRGRILEELESVRVPVLAVAGAEDHAYPQPISGRNIAVACGGQEETVEMCGHSVALEKPGVVAEILMRHFERAR